jgi:hypothetical protein
MVCCAERDIQCLCIDSNNVGTCEITCRIRTKYAFSSYAAFAASLDDRRTGGGNKNP